MKNLLSLRKLDKKFDEFYRHLELEKTSSVLNCTQNLKPILTSGINGKILYITEDFKQAEKMFEMFKALYNDKVCILSPVPDNLVFTKLKSEQTLQENLVKLCKLASGQIDVVVAPVSVCMTYFASREHLKESSVSISDKAQIEPRVLAAKLIAAGYLRQDMARTAGQFSLRGDVLDICPVGEETLYRIEFFDTLIEGIYELDPVTMKQGKKVNNLMLYAGRNVFIDNKEEVINYLNTLKDRPIEDAQASMQFMSNLEYLEDLIQRDESSYALDYIMPIIKDKQSIFQIIKNATVVIDEGKVVYDTAKQLEAEFKNRIKSLKQSGLLFSEQGNFVPFDEFIKSVSKNQSIVFHNISSNNRFFEPKIVFDAGSSYVQKFTHNHKELAETIKRYYFDGYRILVFAGSKIEVASLKSVLENYDVNVSTGNIEDITATDLHISESEYAGGFILNNQKLMVIGTYDFLARKQSESKLKASRNNVFSIPKIGDFVVHSFHGIGVCEGVQKLSGNFGTKDYVVVRYRDGDRLYVPIDQMDMLDRFSGAKEPTKLSKIGGVEFAKVKAKVKASVKKLAFDLVKLYANREAQKGFVYPKDNELQMEFENSFAYTETEDQLASISEIKKDMEQGKVMDRLLCGDVGFGKTEVALRCAFKAVLSGKQVAFLAPTTILSEQHYATVRARMNNFGVNSAVLNRFKTPKQIASTLEALKSGKIDIICGTHRLLSNDVVFNDLGVIILDEEQKFGVEDKEKIKLKYPNVDVLTLSATPIPRTLHMSLSGIRDVSIISTPPSQRLPVNTYVTELTDSLIIDAVNKEISRGGQVFILYNRVEKIESFAYRIKQLLPDVSILIGHGQMGGKQLEDVVYKFYHGEADILICTTIIENGIDIENANTLIVCDSDRFGLSQLYQLRGRVGRGNKMAYAYFTYQNEKVLSTEAIKRLDALSEFTEFGSGFKLAMRDLEIRGSGNILGAEQHGHMEKVGYDLYSKLLSEAVEEIKGNKVNSSEVKVRVNLDAFIPDSYMTKSEERMIAYKSIAGIKTFEDKQKVISSLVNAYGKLPKPTENLIDIAYAKAKARELGAIEIVSSIDKLEIIFESKEQIIGNEKIGELVYKFRDKCHLDFALVPKICLNRQNSAANNFIELQKFLQAV